MPPYHLGSGLEIGLLGPGTSTRNGLASSLRAWTTQPSQPCVSEPVSPSASRQREQEEMASEGSFNVHSFVVSVLVCSKNSYISSSLNYSVVVLPTFALHHSFYRSSLLISNLPLKQGANVFPSSFLPC